MNILSQKKDSIQLRREKHRKYGTCFSCHDGKLIQFFLALQDVQFCLTKIITLQILVCDIWSKSKVKCDTHTSRS